MLGFCEYVNEPRGNFFTGWTTVKLFKKDYAPWSQWVTYKQSILMIRQVLVRISYIIFHKYPHTAVYPNWKFRDFLQFFLTNAGEEPQYKLGPHSSTTSTSQNSYHPGHKVRPIHDLLRTHAVSLMVIQFSLIRQVDGQVVLLGM